LSTCQELVATQFYHQICRNSPYFSLNNSHLVGHATLLLTDIGSARNAQSRGLPRALPNRVTTAFGGTLHQASIYAVATKMPASKWSAPGGRKFRKRRGRENIVKPGAIASFTDFQ
jgi:hypothetical protein